MPLPTTANTPVQARPGFDRFSWQSFIALNWPAGTKRGTPLDPDDPHALMRPGAADSTVWSTYKEAYELFSQGSERPSSWESAEVPVNPCPAADGATRFMAMPTTGGTLLGEVNEAFSFPLIDQQNNYAWSEVRFNKAQYEFIRGEDGDENQDTWLYLVPNLFQAQQAAGDKGLQMPASSAPSTEGALMIKATWRILPKGADTSRYYTVRAQLYDELDPDKPDCTTATMGLVGMHIVQKLENFPQWIWSSFEQVDNIELGPGAPDGLTPSFFDGKPMSKQAREQGFSNRPKDKVPPLLPATKRSPVQVARVNPIPTTPAGASTVDMNRIYQELLDGTVWSHYQLVITQWPTEGSQFVLPSQGGIYPQDAGAAFPAKGCTNVVMETYLQNDDLSGGFGNNCMECHYRAAKSDFSMVLQNRAH